MDSNLHKFGMVLKFIYSMFGLFLGLATIVGGILLFLNGVTGATSWTAELLGFKTNINDAAPGSVLFIVGIFLVLITRFSVNETQSVQTARGDSTRLIKYLEVPKRQRDA